MDKRIGVAALLFCFTAGPGLAGEAPAPRAPLGAQVRDMLPGGDGSTERSGAEVPRDRVRIRNIGNQMLYLSNWDGEAWRTLTVGSGQNLDVQCPRCGDSITIVYHNGKENQTVQTRPGRMYVISWSAQQGVWSLAAAREP